MLIEFEKLQENLVPKPRGGEGEMYTRTFQDENNKASASKSLVI